MKRKRCASFVVALSRLQGRAVRSILLATTVSLFSAQIAYSDLENTATVTGTPRAGTLPSPIEATETVDLVDHINTLAISKSAAITTDGGAAGLGDEGDIITYTYTVTNSGNTTLTDVGVTDTHDGSGTLAAPGFDSWTTQGGSPAATTGDTAITLAPLSVAIFTTTYTITADDILNSGGGLTADDDLDNSAVAVGTSPGGTAGDVTSPASTAFVDLSIDKSLDLLKAAYEAGVPADIAATGLGGATASAGDHAEGETITYVYAVTNDGDVPISNVDVADVHTGNGTLSAIAFNSLANTSGNSVYTSGAIVDTLYPGDVAYFTATYTVTQADIDAQ